MNNIRTIIEYSDHVTELPKEVEDALKSGGQEEDSSDEEEGDGKEKGNISSASASGSGGVSGQQTVVS